VRQERQIDLAQLFEKRQREVFRRMIVKVILSAAVSIFLLAVVASMVVMCLEDTETFRAIDEKVARFIRGEEEE
jgi:hypothetical protein